MGVKEEKGATQRRRGGRSKKNWTEDGKGRKGQESERDGVTKENDERERDIYN